MENDPLAPLPTPPMWYSEDSCRLDEFVSQVSRSTSPESCPRALCVEQNIPVYECERLQRLILNQQEKKGLLTEWAEILSGGCGILLLRAAFPDPAPVDAASRVFRQLIQEQNETAHVSGDHFARPGDNDRIWNALQKLCLRDPQSFALYYSNPFIGLVSECWLGPGYQITSQVNVVNPGGQAQQPHRDYHLGFQTVEEACLYPAPVHRLSPYLTLQGGVAHTEMPVESGPTRLLPFSQTYPAGYLAWRRPDFREFFEKNHVQLPMQKGDALFFNPAVFHAAGDNRTEGVCRMVNLLQVSSAFGRAMESMDRRRMCERLFPELQKLMETGLLDRPGRDFAVAACAEGYAFPTNLDSDPPLGGLAPRSQKSLMLEALDEGWSGHDFGVALQAQSQRRRSFL